MIAYDRIAIELCDPVPRSVPAGSVAIETDPSEQIDRITIFERSEPRRSATKKSSRTFGQSSRRNLRDRFGRFKWRSLPNSAVLPWKRLRLSSRVSLPGLLQGICNYVISHVPRRPPGPPPAPPPPPPPSDLGQEDERRGVHDALGRHVRPPPAIPPKSPGKSGPRHVRVPGQVPSALCRRSRRFSPAKSGHGLYSADRRRETDLLRLAPPDS